MSQHDLDEKITQIQKGWTRAFSLIQMEEAWAQFLDECEEGYNWNIYEFDNDISVRDRIELVLSREDLFGIAAVEHLRAAVANVDERFRALLRNDMSINNDAAHWWRRGVLKYAGQQYAEDVRRRYGIEIETRK
jgi:Xaa-Pro aminopeptidase